MEKEANHGQEELIDVDSDKIQAEVSVDKNILGALSYLWIFSVIIYILKKDDEFLKFHSRQGMVLFILSIVGVFPFFGWPIGIAAFVAILVGALKAYRGNKYRIPLVADLAEKIDF